MSPSPICKKKWPEPGPNGPDGLADLYEEHISGASTAALSDPIFCSAEAPRLDAECAACISWGSMLCTPVGLAVWLRETYKSGHRDCSSEEEAIDFNTQL